MWSYAIIVLLFLGYDECSCIVSDTATVVIKYNKNVKQYRYGMLPAHTNAWLVAFHWEFRQQVMV